VPATTDADHYAAPINPDQRREQLLEPTPGSRGLLSGAPFLVALLIAVILGLRHASAGPQGVVVLFTKGW
jgi:hypothetical protein